MRGFLRKAFESLSRFRESRFGYYVAVAAMLMALLSTSGC